MFEEITVWKSIDANIAVRYVGFRNLETNRIWIAFANYVGVDDGEGRQLTADAMIAAQATVEYFQDVHHVDKELWKPTISEALATFIANNPDT